MDKIEICNMALSRIGVANIEQLNEASEAARACRQFYDHARRIVLRKYPWTWATRRIILASMTETEREPDYAFAYRYPADCVSVRKIYSQNYDNQPGYTPYRIASNDNGRILYTNIEKAICEYTADVTDCSLMDEQFIEALSWKLASSVAFKLTGSVANVQMAENQYNALFLDAVANNEDEQNAAERYDCSLIKARFSGV